MLFRAIFTLIPAFAALTLGAPLNETSLSARNTESGDHYAVVYNGAGCTGNTLDTEIDFGCGGICHQANGIASVFLSQQHPSNPKPTADFFSDSNCKNLIQHAGILSNEHSACTSMNQNANSFYLYFNCHH